jgi:transposase
MPTCRKCTATFSNRLEIEGAVRVLNSRRFCLKCSPFGFHNTSATQPSGVKRVKWQKWGKKEQVKARQLRRNGKFLDEISEFLGINRSTVYGWVRDVPFAGKSKRREQASRHANEQMQAKYAALRHEAYVGMDLRVLNDPLIRDFVVMYLAEGYRRNRNVVHICNTNPAIMRLSLEALRKLGLSNRLAFKLLLYPDHDDQTKKRFWARYLGITSNQIDVWRPEKKQRPSRYRRSEHGIMYMSTGDTYLRSRLQALMDAVETSWKTK